MKSHRSVGVDADPLAVLMSRVWTDNHRHGNLIQYANKVVERAKARTDIHIPWHDSEETKPFVEFWFARKQRRQLAQLALSIRCCRSVPTYVREAMYLAVRQVRLRVLVR
jgi:predicted ATPase